MRGYPLAHRQSELGLPANQYPSAHRPSESVPPIVSSPWLTGRPVQCPLGVSTPGSQAIQVSVLASDPMVIRPRERQPTRRTSED